MCNLSYTLIDFDFVELRASLQFFVYPYPKGSEEPGFRRAGRARRSQNQFNPGNICSLRLLLPS
jgi:hypothetical protein